MFCHQEQERAQQPLHLLSEAPRLSYNLSQARLRQFDLRDKGIEALSLARPRLGHHFFKLLEPLEDVLGQSEKEEGQELHETGIQTGGEQVPQGQRA